MIIFILFFISIFFVILGYGLLIKQLLKNENLVNTLGIGETGLLGFYLILIISISLHFFLTINHYVVFGVYVLGFILFYIYKNNLDFISKKKYYLLIIILIFPALISIKGHPDFEWYHLPYINYLRDFKIIFGVANINDFLGFSQTWIDILALLRFPNIGAKGSNIIPAVFAIFFLFSLIELLSKKNRSNVDIFIYLILIVFISKFNKVSEYGGHVPPILIGILINIYFFKLMMGINQNYKEIIFKILIFFSFVLLLRINYIFILPLILYILIKFNLEILNFIKNKKIIFLLIFIPALYFSKNFIHTGCFSYPVDSTCFSKDKISWSVGKEYAKLRYDGIQAGVRGWNQHILIDGNIEDRIDYLIPLKENKILSHSQYVKKYIKENNFHWLKYWIHSGDVIKILNNIIIILFSLIILFLTNKIFYLNKKETNKYSFLLLGIFFLQLILWFLLTPQTIYGGDVAVVVFVAATCVFFLRKIDFSFKKNLLSIVFLFVLSISYFEYKNFNRIYNEYFKDLDNSKHFPWIKIKKNILNKDYFFINVNDVKINVKNKTKGRKLGLADECGNIDMLCIPIERVQCIEKIVINKSYYFIEGNEKRCVEHLRYRAYY